MSKRFVPVADTEKPRCEQDEESLRKHRKFDTPFAMLPKDLNEKKKTANEDQHPLGKPTGELELDEGGLWRKKSNLFDKQQSWGRETVEYTDPEQAKTDGNKGPKWGRPGVVGWGKQGHFGGRGEDTGLSVTQRREVDQTMEKNEKGLWVKKKAAEGSEEGAAREGFWCCPACDCETAVALEFCRRDECKGRRPASAAKGSGAEPLQGSNSHEDPRLEAAKKKGRGTADAAKEALRALTARRQKETDTKEQLGLMRRRQLSGLGGADCNAPRGRQGGPAMTLNRGSQQAKPSKRQHGMSRWQGVQRTDEEAKNVVSKAVGGNVENSGAPLRVEESDRAALHRKTKRKNGEEVSVSRSRSRSRSSSKAFAWQSRSPSPETAAPEPGEERQEVVVDFF